MLVIRLQRTGKRNQPFFRIVLTEKTSPIKGKYIEALGFLNPEKKKSQIKQDRIKYWISKGAVPSDTVYNLLVEKKIIDKPKIKIKIKSKKKGEKAKTEEKTKSKEIVKEIPKESSLKKTAEKTEKKSNPEKPQEKVAEVKK
ncbi:MAG: 30S ribosomal protein S16 [Patescibacteria group bacterium]